MEGQNDEVSYVRFLSAIQLFLIRLFQIRLPPIRLPVIRLPLPFV